MVFDFTPFEWGLLGFAGFMLLLGIYYVIKDEQKKRETKN